MKRILPKEYFLYYKEKHEDYYKNNKYDFHVGEVVKIVDNKQEQIGIVKNLSNINNYVYILSYNKKENKYCICGFKEKELIKTNLSLNDISDELYNKYCYYIESFRKIKFR
jgi:hypothetical protein